MNKVIGGDYVGYNVMCGQRSVHLKHLTADIELTRADVASLQLVDQTQKTSTTRRLAKGLLFQSIGGTTAGILGGMSAKSRRTLYLAITLNNGRNCLVEVDERTYQKLIRLLY